MRRGQLAAVRLAALAWLAAAAALGVHTGWGQPAWYALPLLVLACAGTELAVVHLQFGRQRWYFSLTEGVLATALVAGVGAWVVVAVAVGTGAAMALRSMPGIKVTYNVAQFALSAAGAAAVAQACGGGIVGAAGGLAAFWLLNHLTVALAIALTSDERYLALVVTSAPLSAVHTAGNGSIGLLGAYLAVEAPLGLLGLVVPLALLWSSYDQSTRRSAEARLFAELARGQEQAAGRSTDSSAQVVLTAAARLFGGADVEMVLLAPDGPVRWVGDENGAPRRSRVDQDAFDEGWVVRALGAQGLLTGVEDDRPWFSAALGAADAPMAVLIARRPAGAPAFGRTEARMAEVLVRQAESWLSVSDLSARHRKASDQATVAGQAARALGDLGAETAPALVLLRESAERLARLASDAGDVAEVVEELHLVERAVASLLGAVALAAEPDLQMPAQRVTDLPPRPATDWTTTGVYR